MRFNLQLKLPPAIVTLVFGAMMWLAANYLRWEWLQFYVPQWLAIVLVMAAALLGVAGLVQFFRVSTTINPHKPDNSRSLVTGGMYRFSRNPMYLALLFILLAYASYLGNAAAFVLLPFYILYMNRYQIIPEEKVLEEKFGAEYREYHSRVRRWL